MLESLRVLILEDSPTDAELIQFELQDAGITFTARVVMTEEDFVHELQEFSPDLILSDYYLPKYNGALALAEARRRCPDSPFILITGAIGEDRAIEILTQGARDYVLKTRLHQRLAPAVKRALSEAEEHRARKKAEAELRQAHITLEEKVKTRTAELEAEVAVRKKTEEALRENEERYRLLAENTTDVIWTLSLETLRFTYISPSVMQMRGYTVDEAMEMTIEQSMSPESYEQAINMMQEELARDRQESVDPKRSRTLELQQPCKDGTYRWAEVTASFIRNAEHAPIQIVGVSRDITERKQAEEAHRETSLRLQESVRAANVGLWDWDLATHRVHYSREWKRQIGYDDAEISDTFEEWESHVHPEDLAPTLEKVREAIAGDSRRYQTEFRFRHKDGSYRWIVAQCSVFRDEGGKAVRVVGSHVDLTEYKQVEDALRESEARFRSYIEHAPYGVFVTDRQGRYVDVNPAAMRITGHSARQLTSMCVSDMLPPESREAGLMHFKTLVETGESVGDTAFRRADGSVGHWMMSATRLGPDRYLGFVEDITVRREREERIAIMGRMVDEAPAAITIHNDEGHFLFANQQTLRLHGYENEEEFLAISLHDLDVPESEAMIAERIRCITEAGEARFETAHFRKDRSILPLEIIAKMINWNGQPAILSIATDITERKRAQEALRDSEQHYRELVTNANSAILRMDSEGRITFFNQFAQRLFGYNAEEVLGRSVMETIVPETDSTGCGLHSMILDIVRRPDSYAQNENENMRRDGSRVWISWTNTPIINSEGNVCEILCIGNDITDLKRAKEALRVSEERFRTLFQFAPVLIDGFEGAGRCVLWNEKCRQVFGWTMEEINQHEDPLSLFYPDPAVRDRVKRSVTSEPDGRFSEFHPMTSDGRELVAMWANFSIPDGTIINVGYDITAQRQAEEQVRKSEEKYRSLFNQSTEGIYLHDLEGRILDVNEVACAQSGYSREEWLGLTVFDGHSSKSTTNLPKAEILHSWRRWDPEKRVIVEAEHQRKDGTVYPVEISMGMVRYGDVNAMLAIVKDVTEHKAAEDKFRLLAQVVEQSPATVVETDLEGRIIYANPKFEETTGYAIAEAIGQNPRILKSGKTPPEEYAKLWATIASGREWRGEFYNKRKDSSMYWESASISPIFDAAGKITNYLAIKEDITLRKRAEEALRESEERHRTILKTAMDGFFVTDSAGRFVEINETYCSMSGYSEQELLRLSVNSVEDVETAADTAAHLQKVMDRGQDRFESRHRRKDGSVFDVEVSVQIRSADELQFVVFVRDITERKQAEEALKNSEYLLNKIFDLLPVGLWFTDKNGRLIRGNPAGVKIWGAEPTVPMEEYGVFKARRLPSGKEIAPDDWALAHTIREEVTIVDELLEIDAFDGQKKIILNYTAPVLDDEGNIQGAIVVNHDISEREKLQSQLLQAQKMESVGRLAGGVAHDFNNMLGVIFGHTEMAMEQVNPALPLYADLQEIRKAAERSSDLTRQLLAFARKQTVSPKVIDLNKTVDGMLKMLHRMIGEDIHLAWLPGADTWPVKMDPSQIDQILANLCVNARDAIAGVGKVTIATGNIAFSEADCAGHAGSAPGEYVLLALSDDGCGMDKETLSHLFEPFFTTKDVGKGTGLGLATVYGIVKQNNGFINVHSEPGQGTNFKVYLPRFIGKTSQEQAEGSQEPVIRGHETVLVVEDEKGLLDLCRRILEKLGYQVLTASTPGEAIKLAEEHAGDIHLLMTDVIMPEMNGRDLAKALLSLYPKIKRLFMSGYTADIIAHHGVLDDGVHFIQKPFTGKKLSTKVRDMLDGE